MSKSSPKKNHSGRPLKKVCPEKTLCIGDFHAPFHDQWVFDNIVYFVIGDGGFERIIIMGDAIDAYPLSRFRKNPKTLQKKTLRGGILAVRDILGVIGSFVPAKIYIPGNHEWHLERTLWELPWVAEFHDGECSWPNILDMEERGFEYHEGMYRLSSRFVAMHGTRATKYTSSQNMQHEGGSGIAGHSHRLDMFPKRDRLGTHRWYGSGHLCRPALMDYTKEGKGEKIADWHLGFSIVYTEGSRFHVEQVFIENRRCIVNGKIYGRK